MSANQNGSLNAVHSMGNEIKETTFSLISFEFNNLPIRIITKKGNEPWFIAKDICECLQLSDTGMVLNDEKRTDITCTYNRNQAMVCINEAGLYRLIFTSCSKNADKFKQWITHEVLPGLRNYDNHEHQTKTLQKQITVAHRVLANLQNALHQTSHPNPPQPFLFIDDNDKEVVEFIVEWLRFNEAHFIELNEKAREFVARIPKQSLYGFRTGHDYYVFPHILKKHIYPRFVSIPEKTLKSIWVLHNLLFRERFNGSHSIKKCLPLFGCQRVYHFRIFVN